MANENKSDSTNNRTKAGTLLDLINKTFSRILKKGFYGEISFHASVQDGEIQDIKKQETEKYK